MKLTFRGHDDRYAVEQSLLAFFPEERPVYEGEDGPRHGEVTLHEGAVYATGVTSLTYDGKTARASARVSLAGAADEYERERLRQRALKLSFFRAARDITGVTPSWGALTGIRPAKLVRTMLEEGYTPARADRELRDVYCVSPARRRLALESAQAGLKAKRDLKPNDISLYIGIPFCPTRCAYCSFVSASVEKSFHLMTPYLEALTAEVEAAGYEDWARRLRAAGSEEAMERLTGLYGVGKKVAQCVCLFGLHQVDAFPVDTHIRRVLEAHYPAGFDLERYKGYGGILQQYLFYYDLAVKSR